MGNPATCMQHGLARPVKRSRRAGAHRHARVVRRAIVAAVAALLLATMVYGESWLLDEPATACVECAVAVTVARALDGHSAER